MIQLICKNCDKEFVVHPYRKDTAIYCSTDCFAHRKILDSTRDKMRESKIGKVAWNKGVKMWENREHPRGTLGKKFPNRKKVSEEVRKQQGKSHIGLKYPNTTGENHWNWRGGISPKNKALRHSSKFKEWRERVFRRDNYTCQECGAKSGNGKRNDLHPHHIKDFSNYTELRFNVDNGITLCKECHYKTDNFGSKNLSDKAIKI